MKLLEQHKKEVSVIAEEISLLFKSKSKKKVRFYHGSNNSTRPDGKEKYFWVDISHLNKVLLVNTKKRYVLVQPNVSMDKLVKETLKFGLIPPVIMEFPGITVGGGVNGAALESSSFRYGQFNDSAIEYEIILGNGEIIYSNTNKNKELFYGISGAYGSLGLISMIKLRLIKVKKYVKLDYKTTTSYEETLKGLYTFCKRRDINYLEGIVYSPTKAIIISGKFVDKKRGDNIKTFSKSNDEWFYRYVENTAANSQKSNDCIPLYEFLFRYNRGAFWMGNYAFPFLHIPNKKIFRYLLNPFMNTRKLFDILHAIDMGQDWFIQDFYVPIKKTVELLKYSEKKLGIWPIWLCPVKATTTSQNLSPHYNKSNMLMDVGIWGQTEKYLKNPILLNRKFENFIGKISGRKMLYAHQYFTEEEFWNKYDKKWYEKIREKYMADKIFPNVWEKTHVNKRYKMKKWRGVIKILTETLQGKNIHP